LLDCAAWTCSLGLTEMRDRANRPWNAIHVHLPEDVQDRRHCRHCRQLVRAEGSPPQV
jgi:hypothetical protein